MAENIMSARKIAIKELVEKGKKKGLLSYKEIADALAEFELEEEQMEKVYDSLDREGIEVVGDLDKELEQIEPVQVEEEIDMDTDLMDIDNWDSFSMMTFIAMAEEKYGAKFEPFAIAGAVLIEDLYIVVKESLGGN